jgi:hypothetical protein
VIGDIVDLSEFVPGVLVFAVLFLAATILAIGFAYAIYSGVRRVRGRLDRSP